ncbi:hypothetical protein [Gracilimonas tropica]|uniref:hypothetical protein n=1 Tax=Gracilimonas tropica TaxID=454600 RepID=UPI00037FB9CB|nr:hypothetical protein [Gracilimonas tropica]
MRSGFASHTGSALHGMDDYLQRTSQNAFKLFAGKLQSATSGRRGQLATMGLNLANLTTSKAGINKIYEQNAGVIDAYFEYVDLVALSKKLTSDDALSSLAKSPLIKYSSTLLIGITIGVLAYRTYNLTSKK